MPLDRSQLLLAGVMRLGPGAHEFAQGATRGIGGPALHNCSDSLRLRRPAFLRLTLSLGDRQPPGEAMIAGRSWTVLDGRGHEIGRVEGDEFVRCGTRLIYRIDGPALYSMDGSARLMALSKGPRSEPGRGGSFSNSSRIELRCSDLRSTVRMQRQAFGPLLRQPMTIYINSFIASR